MAKPGRKKHKCRGKTKQSRYKKRCTHKIESEIYDQGIRYCERHLDQENENDEASSTDSEGEEGNAISSDESEAFQTHAAPFLYLSNTSKPHTDNPRSANNGPQAFDESTKDAKQPEQSQLGTPQRTSFVPSLRSTREEGHGRAERQEAPNPQRTTQNIRQIDSGLVNQRVTQGQRRQSMEPFPSSRSRHPETPEYKYSSVPLARSHSKNHPVQQKPTPDFPSAQWSSRRDPKQEADYTFGNWKAANPFEIPSFSSHAQSRPPSFNQSQVPAPVSANTTFQASTSASGINTQPRRTQREQRFQHSQENVQQAQAPSSTSSSTWVPKFEPGPSSAPFSFNVSPIEGEGRRRTHASAAQIQQQYAFMCERWQELSMGMKDLIGMLQSE